MKIYINKEILIKFIKDHAILTKETIPKTLQWFECDNQVVTLDFVLLAAESCDLIEKSKQQKYNDDKTIIVNHLKTIANLKIRLFSYESMNFWSRVKFAFKGLKK